MFKICSGCSALVERTVDGRCRDCDRRYQRQRNAQPHRRAHRTQRHRRLAAAVFRRDGYACIDCRKQTDLTVDYLLPLQHGGTQTADNAVTRCRSCNARRGIPQKKKLAV